MDVILAGSYNRIGNSLDFSFGLCSMLVINFFLTVSYPTVQLLHLPLPFDLPCFFALASARCILPMGVTGQALRSTALGRVDKVT